MKAAIYCRLSKEDAERAGEKESESIQNQRSMLVKYAAENGYELYRIYSDEDRSGMDRTRPGFNRMLEDARRRKFDSIIVKTQSRFTRDMELIEKYLHGKFAEWGIRFIAVVDHADTADEGNKKSRQINGLVNEWYLEDLSGNVRSVLTHKRKEGKYIGAFALYGYKKAPADHNRLLIDETAAETVRYIFALYLDGHGTTRIAGLLNEAGIPSPTRYRQQQGGGRSSRERCPNADIWGKATVYRMLTNQTYTGNMEQGRHKRISYKSEKTVWLPKQQWIVVPDTHEPIIGRERFERVQQMLRQRARGGGNGKVHPLAGRVVCGICGTLMEQTSSGYKGKKSGCTKKYFRCRMSQRSKARCAGQEYVPLEELQKLLLERIQHHTAGRAGTMEPEAKAATLREKHKSGLLQSELARVELELRRRRNAVKELYLDKSSGLISAVQFDELNREFLKEAEENDRRRLALENAQRAMAAGGPGQPDREKSNVPEAPTLNRILVCTLLNKVTVYPPNGTDNTRKIEFEWSF